MPRALRARDQLLAAGAAEVVLTPGHGGVFEITVDGERRYSKKASGRFPTDMELRALIKS